MNLLTDRIQRLRTQVGALSTRQLQRIDDLDARAITLATQREQITRRRDDLPEPRRRLGREQDPNPVERAHLTSALKAAERELDAVLTQRERLARELGDPSEVRAERDALQLALTKLTREHTQTLGVLAERELGAPGVWATRALGERPAEPQLRKEWDRTVREAARYRLHYDISDTENPLGPQPEPQEQQRDWQRAREVLDRSARRLGRDVDLDQDFTVGMGR